MTELQLVTSPEPLKLDLGCGETPAAGYEGVDKFAPSAKHKVDLFKFPWPWADDSVDALHSSHFLEHIPAREIESRDLREEANADISHSGMIGKDMLCAFMDEAWRVLKKGGEFKIIVPSGRSVRGFMDPTHRRFFHAESFLYFSKAWRDQNKLGHYLCSCDFSLEVNPTVPNDLVARCQEVQAQKYNEAWNATYDFHARLVKL